MEEEKKSVDIAVDPKLVLIAKNISEAISILVFFTGILVLVGWKFNISILTNIVHYFRPMSANAAVGLVCLGISLCLLQEKRVKKWVRKLGRAFALPAFLLGLATFIEYVFGVNLFIDQLLFKDVTESILIIFPGRMGLTAAISFMFFGSALLLLDFKTKHRVCSAQVLSVLAGAISLVTIIGYINDVASFYSGIAIYTTMAIHLAISFFIFHLGILFARPECGLVRALVSSSFSGKIVRRLLPSTFVVPLFFSWLVEYAEHRGLYGERFDLVLNTSAVIIVFSLAILISAIAMERKEDSLRKEQLKSEALAKDLEKFKLATDNEADHVMITDAEGNILYINKAGESITGYTAKEIIGKNAGKLWGGNMSKDFYQNMWRTIKKEKKLFAGELINKRKGNEADVFSGELVNHRKNGQPYTAEVKIIPILDKDKKVLFFVGVERDITKLKEVDQMKSDFISFVSHQLRTPLTVIKWNTEMLRNGGAGDLTTEQKHYLTEIESGEKRMALLISSLLNVSRLEAETIKIEPKPADILSLISSAISELIPVANAKNCAVIFNKPDQPPPLISVDPVLFKQVLLNLLNNATHYSKPKKCKVEVDFKEIEGYYQIDVIDEGIGIPIAAQNKIFDKFFRADNAAQFNTEGTGLGLYITKKIVERSGGKIWFESTEGKGSAFHFTIPKDGMKKVVGEKELAV